MSDNKQPRKIFRDPPVSAESSQSQLDKFKEAARQLETDDDEGRFNERLGKVAKAPPPKDDEKRR